MKTLILGILLLASPSAFTQVPPTVATNIVRLTPTTRLLWDPSTEPGIAGYWAQMAQGSNIWRRFTTNADIPVLTLNSNATSGSYLFSVSAVNRDGLEGGSATLATNLSKLPAVVVNLRLEVTLQ
jgi:hypothetical protein